MKTLYSATKEELLQELKDRELAPKLTAEVIKKINSLRNDIDKLIYVDKIKFPLNDGFNTVLDCCIDFDLNNTGIEDVSVSCVGFTSTHPLLTYLNHEDINGFLTAKEEKSLYKEAKLALEKKIKEIKKFCKDNSIDIDKFWYYSI